MVFLITGGAGFLGKAIVEELLAAWEESSLREIRIIDLCEPDATLTKKPIITNIEGDIRDKHMLEEACKGVDVVIHVAAIVDWGTRTAKEVLDINVSGTKQVIVACIKNKVPYLIYTSSLDAIFNGTSMVNIDESVPFPKKPVNSYCESKKLAEEMVREANGEHLKTCILRPADIYGEADPYHVGSLIDMAKNGFYVRLGNGRSTCQHVYVRNVAYAHVLVAKAMINKNPSVEGNTYFITDGPGKNFFKFYDQVVDGAGYKVWPKNLWLPRWLAFSIGCMFEFLAWLIRPVKKFNPKFSRFAVVYTCSDFTFTADKARKDFNYVPKYSEAEAMNRTIAFYKKMYKES